FPTKKRDYLQEWVVALNEEIKRPKNPDFLRPHFGRFLKTLGQYDISPIFLGEQDSVSLMEYLDSLGIAGQSFGMSKQTLTTIYHARTPQAALEKAVSKHGRVPQETILISNLSQDLVAAKEI